MLGKRLRALAKLLEGAALLLGGAVEIFIIERVLRLAHGVAGIVELVRGVGALAAETVDKALQGIAELRLTLAEIVEPPLSLRARLSAPSCLGRLSVLARFHRALGPLLAAFIVLPLLRPKLDP